MKVEIGPSQEKTVLAEPTILAALAKDAGLEGLQTVNKSNNENNSNK